MVISGAIRKQQKKTQLNSRSAVIEWGVGIFLSGVRGLLASLPEASIDPAIRLSASECNFPP